LEIFGDSFGRLLRRFLESCSWRISLSSVTVVAYNACGGCVRGSSCFQVLSAKRNRWYGSSPVLTVCVAPTPQLLACWKANLARRNRSGYIMSFEGWKRFVYLPLPPHTSHTPTLQCASQICLPALRWLWFSFRTLRFELWPNVAQVRS
jgi:hypothetical protein